MEYGHIGSTIHVPGSGVGAPGTDRQSYIPHTDTEQYIPHSIHRHICYIQTAIHIAYIHKYIAIHSHYIQITDIHTKYGNIRIPTKTHLPQYTSHVLTTHKLQTPHRHHMS